jgi:hypothetical protein
MSLTSREALEEPSAGLRRRSPTVFVPEPVRDIDPDELI